MAISQTIETKTVCVIQETASDCISIRRYPEQNVATGKIDIKYSVDIEYSTKQYQGSSIEDRDELIKNVSSDRMALTPEQTYAMFTTPVTLSDGTQTVLGELLASIADSMISKDAETKTRIQISPRLTIAENTLIENGSISKVIVTNPRSGTTYTWSVVEGLASVTILSNTEILVQITEGELATIKCDASVNNIQESTTISVIK